MNTMYISQNDRSGKILGNPVVILKDKRKERNMKKQNTQKKERKKERWRK